MSRVVEIVVRFYLGLLFLWAVFGVVFILAVLAGLTTVTEMDP